MKLSVVHRKDDKSADHGEMSGYQPCDGGTCFDRHGEKGEILKIGGGRYTAYIWNRENE